MVAGKKMVKAPLKFHVILQDADGNKWEKFDCEVEWLPGGDNKVRVVCPEPATVDEGELLDNWEQNQVQLSVEIDPIECVTKGEAGDWIKVECMELADYASQEGKATLSWVYSPTRTELYLTFAEVE